LSGSGETSPTCDLCAVGVDSTWGAVRLRHSDPHLFMEKIRCDLMVTTSSPKMIGAGRFPHAIRGFLAGLLISTTFQGS
jgi:hypothetical protein